MGRRGCASAMGMIKFPSSCSSPKALCNQFIDYYICSMYNNSIIIAKPHGFLLTSKVLCGYIWSVLRNNISIIGNSIFSSLGKFVLTHWGPVTHICVSKLTIIGSDNGLSPDLRQAIFLTNAGIWLIGPLGTNFSEILIGIHILSFKKMPLKMYSAKCRPFCLGLNVLKLYDSPEHSNNIKYELYGIMT